MNKQHLLIVLSCLCLGLVTFGFSQDTSDTAETTTQVETTTNETENTANATDVTSETSTETSTETDAQTETTEADITESNVTEADATETGTTEISTTKEEQVATENETTASNKNEETTNSEEVASTSDTEDTESGTVSDTESDTESNADDTDADDIEKTTEVNNTNNVTDNADAKERIVTIEYSGGNRKSVDLRYGPWIYSHPDAEGIIGKVGAEEKNGEDNSQLIVYAQEAELKAPEDVLIATAGERVASFTGGVRVERKRLTALGESLEYSEETGFGELLAQERINITVRPKETDGDTTEIQAASATFDVDTDVSVSRGGVTLQSGSQSGEAEEITFEQGLDLAVMISPNGQVTLQRSGEDSNLTITADTVRVLTETKKLMASGNVKLVDGAITTTGETVFFDDEIERAEVFGSPDNLAVSTDSEFDVTIKGQRLEQSIDDDLVEILDETAPNIWNEADFLLTSEIQ